MAEEDTTGGDDDDGDDDDDDEEGEGGGRLWERGGLPSLPPTAARRAVAAGETDISTTSTNSFELEGVPGAALLGVEVFAGVLLA
jgi:hypothetical protein